MSWDLFPAVNLQTNQDVSETSWSEWEKKYYFNTEMNKKNIKEIIIISQYLLIFIKRRGEYIWNEHTRWCKNPFHTNWCARAYNETSWPVFVGSQRNSTEWLVYFACNSGFEVSGSTDRRARKSWMHDMHRVKKETENEKKHRCLLKGITDSSIAPKIDSAALESGMTMCLWKSIRCN